MKWNKSSLLELEIKLWSTLSYKKIPNLNNPNHAVSKSVGFFPQVEYLFTDKTGTLTENTMIFRRCCIGSRQFEVVDGAFCERMDSGINLTSDIQFTVSHTENLQSSSCTDIISISIHCHSLRSHTLTSFGSGPCSCLSFTIEIFILKKYTNIVTSYLVYFLVKQDILSLGILFFGCPVWSRYWWSWL